MSLLRLLRSCCRSSQRLCGARWLLMRQLRREEAKAVANDVPAAPLNERINSNIKESIHVQLMIVDTGAVLNAVPVDEAWVKGQNHPIQ